MQLTARKRKHTTVMKTGILVAIAIITAAMLIPITAQTNSEKKQQPLMAGVPAIVQRRLRAESWPGVIYRVEKQGENYEALIKKDGKEITVVVNSYGMVVSRHEESKKSGDKS